MIPSTELRLKTMIRSLTESILPALDPNNAIAQEQANLLIGHIHVLLDQGGKEPELQLQTTDKMREFTQGLIDHAEGGRETMRAVEQVKDAMANSCYSSLSLAAEQLVMAADGSDSFKQYTHSSVLAFSKQQAERGRDWFKVAGF